MAKVKEHLDKSGHHEHVLTDAEKENLMVIAARDIEFDPTAATAMVDFLIMQRRVLIPAT